MTACTEDDIATAWQVRRLPGNRPLKTLGFSEAGVRSCSSLKVVLGHAQNAQSPWQKLHVPVPELELLPLQNTCHFDSTWAGSMVWGRLHFNSCSLAGGC